MVSPAPAAVTGRSRRGARSSRRARSARRAIARILALAVAALGVATASVAAPSAAGPARADVVRDLQYWLDDYGIRDAWNITRGAGVTIAVIDTGVDSSHPDLAGAVVAGTDMSGVGTADGLTPVGSENSRHGTMVASLAAARGSGPEDGVIGSAPEASILSVSVLLGEEGIDSDAQIADAVRWAVDNGADIINMSLTRNTLTWPTSWDDAFLYAMQNDVVVIAAAGNRGSGTVEVGAPATMPGVLTVAGVDQNRRASAESSSQGITIGVSAPSEGLVGAVPGGRHVSWNGTSGAAPIVAGIAALVRSAHPELDAVNVINRLVATATDVGSPGPDFIYGYGLVNAAAAITADVPGVEVNPMGDLADWIRLNRRAEAPIPNDPQPVPTVPAPSIPEQPEPASQSPLGRELPTVNSLRLVGVPAAIAIGFGAAFTWMIVVLIRQFSRELTRR